MKMDFSNNFNILLFDSSTKSYQQNSLKEFIYYLKFLGKKGIIDFSYASANESIHPELSIKENFILDSVPTSLIKDKEDNLNQTISELENQYLIQLIEKLNCINRKTKELSICEKKLCSIVKSMLSNSEYIFLEAPEQYLDSEILKLIKKCLLYEVEHNKRIVFIKPNSRISWLDIATDIVSKDENNCYVKKQNPLNVKQSPVLKLEKKVVEKPIKQNVYSFTLMKKAS